MAIPLRLDVIPASFITWVEGSKYYARNLETGEIIHDSDASEIIQSSWDTVASLGGGLVFHKAGRYNLNSPLTVPEGVVPVGEMLGAPRATRRTIFVNYFDDHVLTFEGGSGLRNISLAMGTALSSGNAMLYFPSSKHFDFDKPCIVENVAITGAIAANGDAIKIAIDSDDNIVGLYFSKMLIWGFEKGIELLLNSAYPDAAISGNIFSNIKIQNPKYGIYMDKAGANYMSANQFKGIIIQATTSTLRGIRIDGDLGTFMVSIYDIPSDQYGIEVVSGAKGNLIIGRPHSILDNGNETKVLSQEAMQLVTVDKVAESASLAATTGAWTDLLTVSRTIYSTRVAEIKAGFEVLWGGTAGLGYIRLLVDGNIVDGSERALNVGANERAHFNTFDIQTLGPGTHEIKVQYNFDQAATFYHRNLIVKWI